MSKGKKKQVKVQLVSDVHTEFDEDRGIPWAKEMPVGAPVLVVAGDLGTKKTIVGVLEILCSRFDHVVYVAGNHEHYGSSFPEIDSMRAALNESMPKLHWLENTSTEIDGKKFHGTTLWFRDDPMNAIYASQLNDFRTIKDFQMEVYDRNKKAVNFIRDTCSPGDVVVTHHLPSDRSIPEVFKTSKLNCFYVCHMDATMQSRRPGTWLHGHTHASCDYQQGNTRIVCNPFGYYRPEDYIDHRNRKFNPKLVIDV